MSSTLPASEPQQAQASASVTNDFSIQIATVNGSGSQTANLVLLRTLFQMGIPVSGKNMFPSNIAGLPTWYTIRANRRGYISRKKEIDLLVAMNPETARDDVMGLEPGCAVVYDAPLRLDTLRSDLVFYAVPFDKIVAEVCTDAKLRRLVKNMVYDGVLAELLSMDAGEMQQALARQLGKKPKALALNQAALEAGRTWASEHLTKADPFRVERMDKTTGQILIEGNTAAAMGCLFAGVTVVAWYPITPSSSLPETLIRYLRKYRMDPETGKATFAVVQAEDEIASLGMVIGASWAGARAMTSTSGPGISLMSEFAGLAYYAEVPAVVFDVQRVGPSTGLPTRTAQGDILFAAFNSHGDTKNVVLLPGSVEECYEMSMASFDLAERLQTVVFVLSDLDLGMNTWMSKPFDYPEKPIDRGKVLDAEGVKALGGTWGRYRDLDGDGIPYRTLPGVSAKGAYFTRGSGHNQYGGYTEDSAEYQVVLDRLTRKFKRAKTLVPPPVIEATGTSDIALVSVGSSRGAVTEARDILAKRGIAIDYMRIKAFPFTKEVEAFIASHEKIFVVEQNRDAQLKSLLTLETDVPKSKLHSILHYSGLPMTSKEIVEAVLAELGDAKRAQLSAAH